MFADALSSNIQRIVAILSGYRSPVGACRWRATDLIAEQCWLHRIAHDAKPQKCGRAG
jgi:hypothetical protein